MRKPFKHLGVLLIMSIAVLIPAAVRAQTETGAGARQAVSPSPSPGRLPVSLDQAQGIIQSLFGLMGNPDLKMGQVLDKGTSYEAEITNKGVPAYRIMVDKRTGAPSIINLQLQSPAPR